MNCRHQAMIWTNAGILLIKSNGTNFNEILIEIHTRDPFENVVWAMAIILSRPQYVKWKAWHSNKWILPEKDS